MRWGDRKDVDVMCVCACVYRGDEGVGGNGDVEGTVKREARKEIRSTGSTL